MKTPDITYVEHASDILAAIVALIQSGQRAALVCSLAIEGGAARSVGSLAVVQQDGSMVGYLSNGCIDRDIMMRGTQALATGEVQQIRYGVGSPFMDLKLPCGGALDLVIDPAPDLATLTAALDDLRARRATTLGFCPDRGLVAGADAPKRFRYAPKPAILLAGRGAILRTTARIASDMELELHIASPDDPDLAGIARLHPKTTHRMVTPHAAMDLPIDQDTAVLLLFHDHEWEHALLMNAAKAHPFFIGALGSRKTHQIRVQRLLDEGLDPVLCETVRGPVGLVSSLRNATLIAVSALAEVTSMMPPAQVLVA